LFIPEVIYETGESQWNDIDRKLLVRPSQLSGSPTSSIVARRKNGRRE
jgi:hypothetical protein